MLSPEIKNYFISEIFTTHKGKIKIKNSRFTPILFKHRSEFATVDEIIGIIAEELIHTLESHQPKTSWEEMSQDLSHPEWDYIKAKAYIRAERRAMKQSKNIKYSHGEIVPLSIPIEDDGIVFVPRDHMNINEFNESEFSKWFKANRDTVLTERQKRFIDDLSDANYPEKGYTSEYKRLTGRDATEISGHRANVRKRVEKKWAETPKGKSLTDKNFCEMLEGVLLLDDPDFAFFIKEQMIQGTKLALLIEDNITGAANIELNRFVQGKGFLTRPTMYTICNIISEFIEKNGSSTDSE